MIFIAVFFGFVFYQTLTISGLQAELKEANTMKGKKESELSIALAFNQSLNSTVESLTQQLNEGILAEEWRQQLNETLDAELKRSILDLGKLFDEEAKSGIDVCSEQYSLSIYERMLQHYGNRNGDSGSG
jgi:hypothetical protein